MNRRQFMKQCSGVVAGVGGVGSLAAEKKEPSILSSHEDYKALSSPYTFEGKPVPRSTTDIRNADIFEPCGSGHYKKARQRLCVFSAGWRDCKSDSPTFSEPLWLVYHRTAMDRYYEILRPPVMEVVLPQDIHLCIWTSAQVSRLIAEGWEMIYA